ncbi:hypothetical protein [Collinsella intestinalis]|uniref:hypothetical protein n=1 Tax=Collinsella intestinalis TaxID=147207 RepID=UPI0025A37B26|nr:hypothetical protein [Collinsella intestinalis]MDM8162435.1 hypothetical protein [Collinsella intestinalis]
MSEMHDPYDDQLAAARYRAERDQARQECDRLRVRLRDSVPRDAYEGRRTKWLRHIRECETALHRRREYIKKLESAALESRTVREKDREAAEWVREHGGLDEVNRKVAESMQQADEYIALRCSLAERSGDLYEMLEKEDDELIAMLDKRLMPEGMEWPKYTDGELVRIGGCWGKDGCDTSITYIERIIFAEDGVYLDNEYNEAFYRHGERVKRAEPTDSWERLEEDANALAEAEANGRGIYNVANDYCNARGLGDGTVWVLMACDLVRRAKALAERGE